MRNHGSLPSTIAVSRAPRWVGGRKARRAACSWNACREAGGSGVIRVGQASWKTSTGDELREQVDTFGQIAPRPWLDIPVMNEVMGGRRAQMANPSS